MKRQQWRRAVLVMIAVLAGCSDGGGDGDGSSASSTSVTTVSPTTAELGPAVKGEARLEGAVVASGPYDIVFPRTDDRLNSCDKIAAGATGTYLLPLPARLEARQFVWDAYVARYKGPGPYMLGDLGPFAVEVSEGSGAAPVRFVAGPQTTASVEVKADNSGSMSFSNLVAGNQQLSGSADWSCTS